MSDPPTPDTEPTKDPPEGGSSDSNPNDRDIKTGDELHIGEEK